MHKDQEFVEYVVKSIVNDIDKVIITRSVDEMGVLITVEVSVDDMPKIIGKMGNNAKAIRTLLRVVGMKNNARVNLKISEPAGSTRGQDAFVEPSETEHVIYQSNDGGRPTYSKDEE
jgi:predicted RNA-binding protein YlqC (UPF0109 family)